MVKIASLSASLALVFVSCKSSTESVPASVDTSFKVVSPEGGPFTYEPWLVVSPTEKTIAFKYTSKMEGEETAATGEANCKGSPLDPELYQLNSYCRGLTTGGSVAFTVEEPSTGSRSEGSATYQFELTTHEFAITATNASETGSGTTEEKYTAGETLTTCSYSGKNLELMIQMNVDESRVGKGNVAYFLATIQSPESGKSVTVDQDNADAEGQIYIRAASDPTPKKTDNPVNYTTRQSQGTFTNKRPPSSCVFELETVERAKVTKGKLTCVDLAQFDEISNASLIPMGEILDISTTWQCDRYL